MLAPIVCTADEKVPQESAVAGGKPHNRLSRIIVRVGRSDNAEMPPLVWGAHVS
jgi:hypothetical protein